MEAVPDGCADLFEIYPALLRAQRSGLEDAEPADMERNTLVFTVNERGVLGAQTRVRHLRGLPWLDEGRHPDAYPPHHISHTLKVEKTGERTRCRSRPCSGPIARRHPRIISCIHSFMHECVHGVEERVCLDGPMAAAGSPLTMETIRADLGGRRACGSGTPRTELNRDPVQSHEWEPVSGKRSADAILVTAIRLGVQEETLDSMPKSIESLLDDAGRHTKPGMVFDAARMRRAASCADNSGQRLRMYIENRPVFAALLDRADACDLAITRRPPPGCGCGASRQARGARDTRARSQSPFG